MRQIKQLKQDQRGIVSLIMTLVMMIVISLIVLGLAQMSRREERQSLDNQLSLQAFYAAESGVNDVVAAAQQGLSSPGGLTISNDNCNPSVSGIDLSTINVSAANNVAYTCVLVSNSGSGLHSDLAKVVVWPLKYTDGSAIDTVNFSWTENANATVTGIGRCPGVADVSSNDEFINNANWNNSCPYGVVRIDLVPANSINKTSLIQNTMTEFFVPAKNGSAGSVGFAPGPGVHAAWCSADSCQFNVNALTANQYYVRVMEIYGAGQLTVSPAPGKSFTGAQITVDATGKAQDVLRRIKEDVNISTGNTNALGSMPIISGDSVCKRWAIYQDVSINAANSVGECKP